MIYFRKVSFGKSARSFGSIYHLKDGFGLLKEYGENNSFISLISLDLHQHTLKKLHTFNSSSPWPYIFLNQTDSTTFLLTHYIDDEWSCQICKIVDNAIIIEKVIDLNFSPDCFYHKYVYGLKWLSKDNLIVKILKTSN
jgi:hypothetical protein